MKKMMIFSIFFFLFLLNGKVFAEDLVIPEPVGDIYVQDFADLLSTEEEQILRGIGRGLEDQTTAQVVVVTIDTIGDLTVEEYTLEVFRKYGIGNEEQSNGVLLLIGMNPPPGMKERPLRIEVGYGLEGRLPDGKVGRILDDITKPYLKDEQINTAIIETYKVLTNEVLAEYGIQEGYQSIQQPMAVEEEEGLVIPPWLLIIIVLIVLFLDFKFFGGFLTHLLLSIISRGGGRGGGDGGPRGGGGGSSGGGGASRGW
jgi:uncharacterized protein